MSRSGELGPRGSGSVEHERMKCLCKKVSCRVAYIPNMTFETTVTARTWRRLQALGPETAPHFFEALQPRDWQDRIALSNFISRYERQESRTHFLSGSPLAHRHGAKQASPGKEARAQTRQTRVPAKAAEKLATKACARQAQPTRATHPTRRTSPTPSHWRGLLLWLWPTGSSPPARRPTGGRTRRQVRAF